VKEELKPFMAGFDLGGWRLADGTLESSSGEKLNEWPGVIELFGLEYELETVKPGNAKDGKTWENAIYC